MTVRQHSLLLDCKTCIYRCPIPLLYRKRRALVIATARLPKSASCLSVCLYLFACVSFCLSVQRSIHKLLIHPIFHCDTTNQLQTGSGIPSIYCKLERKL